jgi:hypothetical protein
MPTARNIVTVALESMNRLSPGETANADLLAIALRQLNNIADQWSAGRAYLFKDAFTSGVVTGASLTLAAGSFAAIPLGRAIIGATADSYAMQPMSIADYRDIYDKASTGTPQYYAHDGAATVYLYPVAAGETILIHANVEISQFADLDTNYTMPSGYQAGFAASLAVALAPALLGNIPIALEAAKRAAVHGIIGSNMRPAILRGREDVGNIIQGY